MPTSSNYVCVPCGVFMKCEQNGVTVEELMEDGSPYKLWDADKYRCPSCGYEVVSGFGRSPLAEHYEASYGKTREAMSPVLTAK